MRVSRSGEKEIVVNIKSCICYFIVSAICLSIHNIILISMDYINLYFIFSIILSYLIVSFIGYVLHAMMTFCQPLSIFAFAHYALAMSLNVPLALATTWLWRHAVGLPMVWAAPLATVSMLFLNFGLSRLAIVKIGSRQ